MFEFLFTMIMGSIKSLNNACNGDFSLPNYYGNGMVFQAETSSTFWGFSKSLSVHCPITVTFRFNNKEISKGATVEKGTFSRQLH